MRLAIVTGGSRGLGLALCEALSAAGYRVIEFSRGAPHAYSVRVDLSLPEDSARIVAAAIAAVDGKAIEELLVINNAGTLDPIGPAARKAQAAVLANLNANFASAILVLATIMQHFQGAACRKIVANISSGAAQKGYAGWSLYCAAKAGMENFIRSVAVEQQAEPAPFLAINIEPGVIDTQMQAAIRASTAADFPEVARFIKRKEVGELAAPEKVAAAVLRILKLSSLAQGQRYSVSDHAG